MYVGSRYPTPPNVCVIVEAGGHHHGSHFAEQARPQNGLLHGTLSLLLLSSADSCQDDHYAKQCFLCTLEKEKCPKPTVDSMSQCDTKF